MRGPEWHPAFSLKDRRKSKGYKTATAFAHKIGMLAGSWNYCERLNRLPSSYLMAQKVRQILDIPDDVTSIEPMRVVYGERIPAVKVAEAPVQATDEAATPPRNVVKATPSTIDLIAKLNIAVKDVLREGSEKQQREIIAWMRSYLLGLEAGMDVVRKEES
jgi:hypothetical protein|nr:MAG TPA: hypothetical protein [Caudoviricetes sp.]